MTEEEAGSVLDAFCRAAEAETGDVWEVSPRGGAGGHQIVQKFRAAAAAARDPAVPEEKRSRLVMECIYLSSSGRLADLVEALAERAAESLEDGFVFWPLPWLDGCGSVEEMALRLAAYAP